MQKVENLSEEYKNLTENIDDFIKNQQNITKIALDIFINIAKISNLELKPVYLRKMESVLEQYQGLIKEATPIPSIPEFGEVKITNTYGTVVFVDITKSTGYFEEEKNYTGFVIFNAYILLVKTITKLTGGEFLEHTGDGAMIFFEYKDIITDYRNCKNFNEENPLCLYFIVSEHLKNYSKEKALINFDSEGYFTIEEPALVHIGADYGNILEINLGDLKKN
ncbi:hypothetical protein [Persephonella hydrogeniphila]|uniref:hypothetical protein n=1 Tax=Persephonella hydrogeniphila TaxID=198703 RepID=UPI000BE2272B|nr:hypothetical protein [Persephonella hydrogeniphila]